MIIDSKEELTGKEDPKKSILRTGSQFLMMNGYRGSGKSLLGAYYCKWAESNGCNVFSLNQTLNFGRNMELEELLTLDEELNGSVIFLDEFQTLGTDSIRSTSSMGVVISQLLYQVRKRNLVIIANTQNYYDTIASRVQYQVNWVIDCKYKKDIDTIFFKSTHTGSNEIPRGISNTGRLYRASRFWNLYKTQQIQDPYKQFTITAETIREGEEQKTINRVFNILKYIAENEGIEELPFREIFSVMNENGLSLTQTRLGRWLRSRLPVRKSGENRYYDISVLSDNFD
tara:strand:+ start:18468 stop:19325 length:858 start_codon:yes stop_codon:yes gene_type:complete